MDAQRASKKKSGEDIEHSVDFPVVGLGASAGGLEALKKFFSELPEDSGAAYVVVQHLDPNHESMMAELLGRVTNVPVTQVNEKTLVEPDHVYLTPPRKELALKDGHLELEEFSEPRGVRMPVNVLLRSLAEVQQQRAIGIIFSGTGSDGTEGIKAIKEAGGLTMVQEPDDCSHDGMPQSALVTDAVDICRPANELPHVLIQCINHPYFGRKEESPSYADECRSHLDKILDRVKKRTRHDFHHYKEGTLIRRIERRMSLRQLTEISDYLEVLEEHPEEIVDLTRDLLIGVTSFFRDAEAFEKLSGLVIDRICDAVDSDLPIRIWVPGTATGEEAYSLAMLLDQKLDDKDKKDCSFQVFATDVDPNSLEKARRGIYPESIAADVPGKQLERYFTHQEGHYVVQKRIRDTITFSVQNLLQDPPFSRLNLISCRNLLIYLTPEIQRKVIRYFHFALKPGGFLFLGTAESVGADRDLFKPLDKKWKIYQRVGAGRSNLLDLPLQVPSGKRESRDETSESRPNRLKEVGHNFLLEQYAPSAVIINQRYDILHVIGDTREYLHLPQGDPLVNLFSMASTRLRHALRSCLHKLNENAEDNQSTEVRLEEPTRQGNKVIVIDVHQLPSGGHEEELILVAFKERQEYSRVESESQSEVHAGEEKDQVIHQLEYELRTTREELESTIEQLETANEELTASNEEVMSMNEEFQSTNEELETSKEELQSLNEELSTVNSELQDKVAQQEVLTNDLNNLISSSDIGTLILDRSLNIKRYTPAMTDLVRLRPTDVGRPLSDFDFTFEDPSLLDDAKQVIEKLRPIEKEVATAEGEYYLRRVLPYRTDDDRIDGVVVSFSDITEIKRAQENIARRELLMSMLNNSLPACMAYVDREGIYRYANETYRDWFEQAPEEIVGRHLKDVLGAAAYKAIKPKFDKALKGKNIDWEAELDFKHGKSRYVSVSYSPHKENGEVLGVSALIVDVTDRRKAEAARQRLAALVETSEVAILSKSFDGVIQTWNQGAEHIYGYTAEEVIGKHVDILIPEELEEGPGSRKHIKKVLRKLKKGDSVDTITSRRRRKDGSLIDVLLSMAAVEDQKGKPVHASVVAMDITARKAAEAGYREMQEVHRIVGETIPFGTWTCDAEGRCTMVTQPFTDAIGMTQEEVLEFGWLDRVKPEEKDSLIEAWMHCVETGEDWDYEYTIKGQDGRWLSVLTKARPVRDEDGQIQYWAGFHLDNTENQRVAQELQELNTRLEETVEVRTMEATQKARRLRELASELSRAEREERRRIADLLHNSLQQLLVAANMRLPRLATNEEVDQRKEMTDEVSDLLGQAIDETRSLSVELNPPILHHGGLVAGIQWLSDWMKEKHDLQVHVKAEADKEPESESIKYQLFESIRELLFNVVKHAGVKEAEVSVTSTDSDCLEIVVKDGGAGFDVDCQREKQHGKGGLGLWSIEDRIGILGGEMKVESQPGHGCRVTLISPLTLDGNGDPIEDCEEDSGQIDVPTERKVRRLPEYARKNGKISVVVADDHQIVREGLVGILNEEEDFVVVGEAENGREAIDIVSELKPDVLIVDVNMPVMNGVEATRHLSEEMPDLHIIALSVNDDSRTQHAMLEAGVACYLTKGGDFQDLCNAIRAYNIDEAEASNDIAG